MNVDWYLCRELKDPDDKINTYTFLCVNCKFIGEANRFKKLDNGVIESYELVSLYSKIPFWEKYRLEQQLTEKRQKSAQVSCCGSLYFSYKRVQDRQSA